MANNTPPVVRRRPARRMSAAPAAQRGPAQASKRAQALAHFRAAKVFLKRKAAKVWPHVKRTVRLGSTGVLLGGKGLWWGVKKIPVRKATKAGVHAVGVTDKTLPSLKESVLPIIAGLVAVVAAKENHLFSPSETLMQGTFEGALAFGLPAAAVALVRNFVAKPTLGRLTRNIAIGVVTLAGTIYGVHKGIEVGALPDNSPMLNAIVRPFGSPQAHDRQAIGIIKEGPVEAKMGGFLFDTFALDKGAKAVKPFSAGDQFCVTFAVIGDKPFVQIEQDGKKLYAPNAPGFFKPAAPDSKACPPVKSSAAPRL